MRTESDGPAQHPVRAQIDAAPLDARLERSEGSWVLALQRVLTHRPEHVWPMLTDPVQLARWSAVVPDRSLDEPGPALARAERYAAATRADVLVSEPPHLLVHCWGSSTLRWTLEAVATGTRLTLEHTFPDRATAPVYAAGWHVCLGTLSALDAGSEVSRVVGPDAMAFGWQDLHDRYAAHLGDDTSSTPPRPSPRSRP